MSKATQFLIDLAAYREPLTKAVSVHKNPPDYSCDNGIDFTAVAIRVGARIGAQITGFKRMCVMYEARESGEFMRHPTATTSMSWDDHTSAAAMSSWLAWRILRYGQTHNWTWDVGTKKLWRLPIFVPTVKAGTIGSINILWQAWASIAYIANCFEGAEHTSGKKSLWVAQEALYGSGFLITKVIDLWRWAQMKRYPGGIQDVFKVYFGPDHPIARYSPNDFN